MDSFKRNKVYAFIKDQVSKEAKLLLYTGDAVRYHYGDYVDGNGNLVMYATIHVTKRAYNKDRDLVYFVLKYLTETINDVTGAIYNILIFQGPNKIIGVGKDQMAIDIIYTYKTKN